DLLRAPAFAQQLVHHDLQFFISQKPQPLMLTAPPPGELVSRTQVIRFALNHIALQFSADSAGLPPKTTRYGAHGKAFFTTNLDECTLADCKLLISHRWLSSLFVLANSIWRYTADGSFFSPPPGVALQM